MNQEELKKGTKEALEDAENAQTYEEANYILKVAMLTVLTEICWRM